MTFAARLSAERMTRGLSKRALAIRAGLSPAYLTLLEQGRRAPARAAVEALGTALSSGSGPEVPGSDSVTAHLLDAAGFTHASGDVAEERPCAKSAAALAALFADETLPGPVRADLGEVVTELILAIHARLRQGVPHEVSAADLRRMVASSLSEPGVEEDAVRRVLEELRSPVYDL